MTMYVIKNDDGQFEISCEKYSVERVSKFFLETVAFTYEHAPTYYYDMLSDVIVKVGMGMGFRIGNVVIYTE